MKATLDLIEKAESSDFYRGLASTFRKALAARDEAARTPIATIIDPTSPEEADVRIKILFFLNHYELIAVGFENRVIDKGFYASFMRGAVVHDWTVARDLILQLREPDPVQPTPRKIYERFEALAREWSWEIQHENHLRLRGISEAKIAKAIATFRAHPRRRRPDHDAMSSG